MSHFYRVSMGKGAALLDDGLAQGYVGTGWMPAVDLTGRLSSSWRDFNAEFIPILKAVSDISSNIAAGLGCGMTWTVAQGIDVGDVILTPTGQGTYRVARATGPYFYAPDTALPHRRPVQWLSHEIPRDEMSDILKASLGSSATVVAIRDEFAPELTELLGTPKVFPSLAGADVDRPTNFALEKHLEDFLIANWPSTQLGHDYDVYTDEHGEQIGQQFPTDTGPLDILAQRKDGNELLVVELKRGKVSDVVVGQILRYMGYVKELEPGKIVRGVIIGLEDDPRLTRALSMVPFVTFMRYELKFRLIGGAPPAP